MPVRLDHPRVGVQRIVRVDLMERAAGPVGLDVLGEGLAELADLLLAEDAAQVDGAGPVVGRGQAARIQEGGLEDLEPALVRRVLREVRGRGGRVPAAGRTGGRGAVLSGGHGVSLVLWTTADQVIGEHEHGRSC